MAGAVAPCVVGSGYLPYPHEKGPVVVRVQADDKFHVCKRERLGRGWWYRIVAEVAGRELADALVATLTRHKV